MRPRAAVFSSLVALVLAATGVMPLAAAEATDTGPTCTDTVFGSTTPAVASEADPHPVEVGVRLRTRALVTLLGLRFFKGAENNGSHVGHLWTGGGELLRRVVFTAETGSGWQEAFFDAPVHLSPGSTFVASYHAPSGRYAEEHRGLVNGVDAGGPVYAPADGAFGPNGVYLYGAGGVFPTQSHAATNYFVDVIIKRPSPPLPPQRLAAPVKSSNAVLLTWAPSPGRAEGGGGVAEYVVFRDGTEIAALPASARGYTDRTVRPGLTYVYTVKARDECGSLGPGADEVVVSVPQEAQSLFGKRIPSGPMAEDRLAVEIGVKFRTDVDGVVRGVRFYRHTAIESGYLASLWTSDGTLLASGRVVEGQAPSAGYQEVRFAAPVPVHAGTTYVASYFASEGRYAFEAGGLSRPLRNGNLTALDDESAGGNGVYRYSATSTFPTRTYAAANYWVDVTFVPST